MNTTGTARTADAARVTVRPMDRPGDLGWVVQAHGEVYAEQFGWNRSFEALVARIVADHAAGRSPGREAAWIAEVDGRRAGSVCCVADDEDQEAARLRLLLVLPSARGLGIGTRLVEECLRFAGETGYRRITLWTTDVLVSARRIYQAAGFELVDQEPHRGFGPEVMGQNWQRDL